MKSLMEYFKGILNFKRNLILGAIGNLNWETIKYFFISLEYANIKKCDIVMFVINLNESIINEIKSYGVLIQKIPEEFKNMRINNYRYKLYADFLLDKLNKYNMVLCTDVRDVIFQKDIFKYYDKYTNFLGLAIEDGILTQKFNKMWLNQHYGKELYNSIKDLPIICSGTILATPKIFYNLSKTIWEGINSTKIPIPFNSRHDQAVLNYIIYHLRMFKDCIIESNIKDGPIMTLDVFLKKKKCPLDSENNILNEKGEIVAMAHQYDRSLDLTKILKNKYKERIKKSEEKNNNIIYNKYYIIFVIFFLLIFIIIFIILKVRKKNKNIIKKNKKTKRILFGAFLKKKKNKLKESDKIPFNKV